MLDGKTLYSIFEAAMGGQMTAWEHLTQRERNAWERTADEAYEYLEYDD